MSTAKLDTHYYDTKWASIYKELRQTDINLLIQPKEHSESINECFIRAKSLYNGVQLKQIYGVLNWFINPKDERNYDKKNNLSIADIFPRVWRFVKDYDDVSIKLFYEQIIDVIGGPCSQGRTTRMFQFYQIHMDNSDPIFKKNLRNP